MSRIGVGYENSIDPHYLGLFLFMFCLVVLILAGCSNPPPPQSNSLTESIRATPPPDRAATTARSSLANEWQSRWLMGIPCRVPCWEGVTPGLTSFDEAITLLKSNPLVSSVEYGISPLDSSKGYISWNWKDGSIGGDMSFDAKSSNKVIYKIRPALGGTYLLGDIIKAFGEPSHISAIISKFPDYEHVRSTPSPSGMTAIITNYDLGLLYLPQGFITGNTSSIKPSLGPNLALYPPVFFLPTLEGYAKALNKKQQDLDLFAPWQGFRDFDYYCRNLPDMSTCPR